MIEGLAGLSGGHANEIASWAPALRAVVACLGMALFARNATPRRRILAPTAWRDGSPVQRALWQACRALWQACRALPLLALIAAVVIEKVVGLTFVWDMLFVSGVFTAYLLTTRNIGVRNSIWRGIAMFLCTDLCVALANSVYRNGPALDTIPKMALVEAGHAAVLLGLCLLLRHFAPTSREPSIPPLGFASLLLALLPYVVLRSSSLFYEIEGAAGTMMEALLLLTITAALGAFAGNRSALVAEAERARRLELEVELREREQRYQVRRETMAEVNRRYHDMVKYARLCAQRGSTGADPDELDGCLERRMTADLTGLCLRPCGNDTLDAILWEADGRCRELGLRLSPVVDAGAETLGRIAGYDLHCLVGNALDNAIEAAAQVSEDEPERREIRLRVTQVGQMLFVRVTNHFAPAQAPQVEGGRLLTSKADRTSHGFGVENMRRTAEAHGGSLAYEIEGDRFTLTALVPLG